MSWLESIGLFVGLPVGLFVVISVLVFASSARRRPSYRPGLSWWAAPQWFGARPVEEAAAGAATGGGAEPERGGVGARW